MSANGRYNGPADPSTPCDLCGGPTYTFVSGSIWCPFEDHRPERGTHWVRRMFFESEPGSTAEAVHRLTNRATPRGPKKAVSPSVAQRAKPVAKPKPVESFDLGIDAFVER